MRYKATHGDQSENVIPTATCDASRYILKQIPGWTIDRRYRLRCRTDRWQNVVAHVVYIYIERERERCVYMNIYNIHKYTHTYIRTYIHTYIHVPPGARGIGAPRIEAVSMLKYRTLPMSKGPNRSIPCIVIAIACYCRGKRLPIFTHAHTSLNKVLWCRNHDSNIDRDFACQISISYQRL